MFENGCFLRRQKRFKCPRKEMMRTSRASTTGSSHVDGTTSGGDQTTECELSPGQSATLTLTYSGADDSNNDNFRKPIVPDDVKPAPERLFPLPGTGPAYRGNVSLLQAIASAGDYTRACSTVFPLTYSSGDVLHRQGYGGGLTAQPHCFDDRHNPHYSNLALLQQPHLTVSASSNTGYLNSSTLFAGPEILTSTTAFPVQRYRGDGGQQLGIDGTASRLGDQLQAALSYRSSSQQLARLPGVHHQLQQPCYQHHPASDGDRVVAVGGIPADCSALSFNPYHFVQTRFDSGQRQSFRSPSCFGSAQRPYSHQTVLAGSDQADR